MTETQDRRATYGLINVIQGLGKFIAYHPALNHITGHALASILLKEFIYWDDFSAHDDDGFFEKPLVEIMKATGFSEAELNAARKNLTSRNLIEEKRRGLPARLFFRLNHQSIQDAWEAYMCGRAKSAIEARREEVAQKRIQGRKDGGKFTGNQESSSPVEPQTSFPLNEDLTTMRVSGHSSVSGLTGNWMPDQRVTSERLNGTHSIYPDLDLKTKKEERSPLTPQGGDAIASLFNRPEDDLSDEEFALKMSVELSNIVQFPGGVNKSPEGAENPAPNSTAKKKNRDKALPKTPPTREEFFALPREERKLPSWSAVSSNWTVEQLRELLEFPEAFASAWKNYSAKCKASGNGIGSSFPAVYWWIVDLELPGRLDDFKEGWRLHFGAFPNESLMHFYSFIHGRKQDGWIPKWKQALDEARRPDENVPNFLSDTPIAPPTQYIPGDTPLEAAKKLVAERDNPNPDRPKVDTSLIKNFLAELQAKKASGG